MAMNIEVVETKLYSAVVADEIIASISDAISDTGKCSLVLAGGKTPSVIYRTIAKPPRVNEVEWDKVQLFWGDERWVAREDTQSNFKMVNETLLTFLINRKPAVRAVDTSLSSPEEGARAYEDSIRQTIGIGASEIPVFDLVLLGVGEDGHTASIFPHSDLLADAFESAGSVCKAVPCPYDGSWRVTLSPAVLLAARKIIFIVRGEGKSSILRKVLEGETDVRTLPAQLFRQARGKVTFFLDTAAAQQISAK